MKYESSREPVRLQADSVTYDRGENTYLAEGKVEMWQGDRKLTADRVVLNAETQEAEATGKVILVQGDDVLRSERMKIDLDTSLGIVVKGTLFLKKQNYYLRGEEIERVGEDTYRVREGSFTTCDGDWPAWRFTGREALITLEEYAGVWGATFQIKNFPILYSPYLFFPVKTRRQSGFLIPSVSFSDTGGAGIGLAYFWAMAKNQDATFYLDLFEKKGIGEGVEYRYVRKRESSGSLYGYHIREWQDYRQKYKELLDRKPNRWQVDFRHEEYFSPTFFTKTQWRGFSDRQYFKDYGLSPEDRSAEQIYSFLSLTKNWGRYSFWGEARHTVDVRQEDKTTLQYYPLTHFIGVSQPLFGTPVFFSFDSSYGYFWREEGTTGHRVDLFPRISLPAKWGGLELNTELGGRETWYAGIDGTDQSRSRELWDFRVSLAGDLYRIFETGSESVPRLKHVIRPEITYTYIPDVDQSKIPNYDLPVPKANEIFYGFSSRLIGKVGERSKSRYHEFVYLRVGQKYDLFEATRSLGPSSEPKRPFGVISAEWKVRSLQYLSLENITNYDPNKNEIQTAYSLLGISDSRGDSLSLEHIYRKGVEEQMNGSIRLQLFPSLDFSYGRRYSLRDRTTLDTTYGLTYRHQCWGVDVSYVERPAISGAPAEKKILFLFTLMGVTTVGTR